MEFNVCHEFVVKKGDHVYTLHIPPNAQPGELFDVTLQMFARAQQIVREQAEAFTPKTVSEDKA